MTSQLEQSKQPGQSNIDMRPPRPWAPIIAGSITGVLFSGGRLEGAVLGAVGGFTSWCIVEKVDLPGPLANWQRQLRNGTLPSEDRVKNTLIV